jgi:hypothetical protein
MGLPSNIEIVSLGCSERSTPDTDSPQRREHEDEVFSCLESRRFRVGFAVGERCRDYRPFVGLCGFNPRHLRQRFGRLVLVGLRPVHHDRQEHRERLERSPHRNLHRHRGSFSDSHSLSQFLGVDATSIVGANSASLSHSVAEFTGYIDIPAAGSYTFGVGSDDGMELLIGGKTIAEYSSQRGYGVTEGTASFSQAGLYPITLWYYEYGGKTGVSLLDGAGNVIPQSDLYTAVSSGSPSPTIPEPALLGYGATGLLLLTRRRKE